MTDLDKQIDELERFGAMPDTNKQYKKLGELYETRIAEITDRLTQLRGKE